MIAKTDFKRWPVTNSQVMPGGRSVFRSERRSVMSQESGNNNEYGWVISLVGHVLLAAALYFHPTPLPLPAAGEENGIEVEFGEAAAAPPSPAPSVPSIITKPEVKPEPKPEPKTEPKPPVVPQPEKPVTHAEPKPEPVPPVPIPPVKIPAQPQENTQRAPIDHEGELPPSQSVIPKPVPPKPQLKPVPPTMQVKPDPVKPDPVKPLVKPEPVKPVVKNEPKKPSLQEVLQSIPNAPAVKSPPAKNNAKSLDDVLKGLPAPHTTTAKAGAASLDSILSRANAAANGKASAGNGTKAAAGKGHHGGSPLSGSELDGMRQKIRENWGLAIESDGDTTASFQLDQNGLIVNGASGVKKVSGDDDAFRRARRALLMAQPFRLPIEKYDSWREMTVNFSTAGVDF